MEYQVKTEKKVQYITIDSVGHGNNFTIDFNLKSNVFIQEMRDVIGIKLVDAYFSNLSADINYVDILCPTVPLPGQILDERHGQLFARVPVDQPYSWGKQWRQFKQKSSYFNPIALNKLAFQIYESDNNNVYQPLSSDTTYYFILEVTTIDHATMPADTVLAINRLIEKIEELNNNVRRLPDPAEEAKKKKKIPLVYLLAGLIAAFGLWVYVIKPSFQSGPQTAGTPGALGPPGALPQGGALGQVGPPPLVPIRPGGYR